MIISLPVDILLIKTRSKHRHKHLC